MNTDLKVEDLTTTYTELYAKNRDDIFAQTPDFINETREDALKAFRRLGFPKRKAEDYKYTRIEELFNREIDLVTFPGKSELDVGELFTCDVPELDTTVLLVLNSFYKSKDEKLTTLKNGIVYGSMNEAARVYPDLVQKHYAKYADYKTEALTALNTAFAQDGIFIYVPDNVRSDKPFQIINLLHSNKKLLDQHRNLFILGKNSSLDVVICDHTLSGVPFVTNSMTEAYVGQNAALDITRMQNEHNNSVQVTNSYIYQARDSRATTNVITLHGGSIRNNLRVYLDGEGCENHSYGLFLADQEQHVDNFTYINHLKPNCMSNQLYKGILDDKATGAFSGKIHVWKDAQKTIAYQKNNNILLSDDAKMNSKPQLEIYADDVKCSHGATVGQLDQDALFYLRSRGIPEKESLLLLMYAFAYEVVSKINIPALKERTDELIDKRLRGELSRCYNCKMKCD
ncbi:MAG TPA: Fe-S cluster assembly protein SufD [Bacteroidales bacterium]|nr:Fe-S cluster assembly protein SufD [Bacteroidales bacterium]